MCDNERKRMEAEAIISSMMPIRQDAVIEMAADLYSYGFVFLRINLDGDFERISPERVSIQDEEDGDV